MHGRCLLWEMGGGMETRFSVEGNVATLVFFHNGSGAAFKFMVALG